MAILFGGLIKMARKPKISPDLIDEILTYKENGISDADICDMVGIATQTFYKWLKEAETGTDYDDPEKPAAYLKLKRDLSDGLKRARVAFKAYHIQNVTTASKKDWTASAWILERMYPKEFSRIDRQIALQSDGKKDNGMLDEILDYLGMAKK
jgi:transposase-like protein